MNNPPSRTRLILLLATVFCILFVQQNCMKLYADFCPNYTGYKNSKIINNEFNLPDKEFVKVTTTYAYKKWDVVKIRWLKHEFVGGRYKITQAVIYIR